MKAIGIAAAVLAWAACVPATAQAQPANRPQPPASDAIVPDAEFEAALPKVDGDINAPLQPLQSFGAQPTGARPATAPTPQPLAPQPASAPPSLDAPLPPPDPALAEPLPPLASFDVTTPTQPVTAEQEENAATVRYRVAVEGLKQVGLEGRFRGLSALDKGDGQAANGAVITARAREDERLALTVLQSEGYYDAVVTSRVEPVPNEPNRVTATISAVPGPRYALGAIMIKGPETVPPMLARDALKLKSGDPIVAADVEAAEANVRLRLPQNGYPFVEIGRRDVLLDPATHIGDYTLPVEPGARSSFGGFTTEGKLAFDAHHVGVLSRFKRGDLYDSRKVDDLREAMVATGLFSSVAAEPVATGQPGPDGTQLVDIRVVQQTGPPRTLAGQAGYATGQGFTLRGSWTHRNLFPPEGALIVTGVAGTQEQGASVAFRRSNAGKRDRTVNLSLNAAHQDFAAYEAFTASLNGNISRQSTPIWQKQWTWSYGFELITTDEKRRDPTRVRDDGTYFIGALPAQIGYDRSNNLLDPTRGFRLAARVSPEISQKAKGGFDRYVRTLFDASLYYPAGDSLTIAARARVGSIVGAARDQIAPSRRLYAGGGGSVRGFGYQELGPRDANNTPIGGRSLNEAALEVRYRFGNYGIVPFIDAGQVYESSTPKFSDIRYGVGIGGRLYTNFGPLRVDIATPLNRRPGEARFTAYVSIGQAF